MPRKPSRRREPSPEQEGQQILEAAAKAGTDYAHEQVGSPHFRDWVADQMVEAEAMRKRDPSSVIPLETPADARKVARNMLQQLEWDTKRQMDQREILELAGATGVFGAGSDDWVRDKYGITRKGVTDAFFEAFDEQLSSPSTRDWLTDLVLETNEDLRKARRRAPIARERAGIIDWDDGPASQGQWFGRVGGREAYVITTNTSDEARRATGLSWGGYALARVTPGGDRHIGYFRTRGIAQSQASSDLVAARTSGAAPQTWAERRSRPGRQPIRRRALGR